MKNIAFALLFAALPLAAQAEISQVVAVSVAKNGMTWRMDVTIKHPDTGWDHFADGWEVLDAEGNRIGHRELMHPHVEEQPFTRSLSNLIIPDGTREVFVRTHCSVDGWSKERIRVPLDP